MNPTVTHARKPVTGERRSRWLALASSLLALLALAGSSPIGIAAAQGRLVVGGNDAGAGIHALAAGFTPDPFSIAVRALGVLHAPDLRLGPGCRGYLSGRPDLILRWSGAASFLRIFARAAAGTDVTLVVNDPTGRFYCNDDVVPGRDTNPMVDIYQPRAGQYDIWVGAHAPNVQVEASVFVSELRTQRP
jgi:hypothetical protein